MIAKVGAGLLRNPVIWLSDIMNMILRHFVLFEGFQAFSPIKICYIFDSKM